MKQQRLNSLFRPSTYGSVRCTFRSSNSYSNELQPRRVSYFIERTAAAGWKRPVRANDINRQCPIVLDAQHFGRQHLQQQQQHRTYLFFPTSWKEFEIRFLRKFREQRTVHVTLLKRQHEKTSHIIKEKLKGYYQVGRRNFVKRKVNSLKLINNWLTTLQKRRSLMITNTNSKWNTRIKTDLAIRWKNRSVYVQNHVIRRTRHYKDRIQRLMNRNVTRATKWWKQRQQSLTDLTSTTTTTTKKSIIIKEYSESSWFCTTTGRPITSRDATGRFVNPWLSESTDGVKSIQDIVRWRFDRMKRTTRLFLSWLLDSNAQQQQRIAFADSIDKSVTRQHQCQNLEITNKFKKNATIESDEMKLTWIGHSTCLLQHGSISILTDPIFSERCSPFQTLPIGVARDISPGVTIDDLPSNIDLCLISHDHYDHLDKESILFLTSKVTFWVVPLGLKQWILDNSSIRTDQIMELEWWESIQFARSDNDDNWRNVSRHSAFHNPTVPHPANDEENEISSSSTMSKKAAINSIWVTCCPAQHWGSRTFLDRNYRLWCSYAVLFPSTKSKFYFAGDTALPTEFPLFQQIRDYIGGSIDLAAIPIGAYEPSFFMYDSHVNPFEAVQIHKLLDVKQSVGIHWGTFALSEEPFDQPPILLQQAAENASANFITMRQGDGISVKCNNI